MSGSATLATARFRLATVATRINATSTHTDTGAGRPGVGVGDPEGGLSAGAGSGPAGRTTGTGSRWGAGVLSATTPPSVAARGPSDIGIAPLGTAPAAQRGGGPCRGCAEKPPRDLGDIILPN